MTGKLRIKARGIEIEWEGDVEFLKNDLPKLISALSEILVPAVGDDLEGEAKEVSENRVHKKFTSSSIAAIAKPKGAPELFKIALAKLQLSDKVEPATRAQILSEMKLVPTFYRDSMSGNLSTTISRLLAAGAINEPVSGKFTLSQPEQDNFRATYIK